MQLRSAAVVPRDDMLCPSGSWAGISAQPGEWQERLIRQDQDWERYAVVVQAWNKAVGARPADSGYVLDQYLAYVVAAYDHLNTFPDQLPAITAHDAALTALAQAWAADD